MSSQGEPNGHRIHPTLGFPALYAAFMCNFCSNKYKKTSVLLQFNIGRAVYYEFMFNPLANSVVFASACGFFSSNTFKS